MKNTTLRQHVTESLQAGSYINDDKAWKSMLEGIPPSKGRAQPLDTNVEEDFVVYELFEQLTAKHILDLAEEHYTAKGYQLKESFHPGCNSIRLGHAEETDIVVNVVTIPGCVPSATVKAYIC